MSQEQNKIVIMDRAAPGDLFRMMRSGVSALVICKSRYEASERATAYYRDVAGPAGASMVVGRNIITYPASGANIEFGWIETQSGRRLDDFGMVAFEVYDPMRRISYP